jgi:hypothetical protein
MVSEAAAAGQGRARARGHTTGGASAPGFPSRCAMSVVRTLTEYAISSARTQDRASTSPPVWAWWGGELRGQRRVVVAGVEWHAAGAGDVAQSADVGGLRRGEHGGAGESVTDHTVGEGDDLGDVVDDGLEDRRVGQRSQNGAAGGWIAPRSRRCPVTWSLIS